MKPRAILGAATAVVLASGWLCAPAARELTIEERIKAQEALDRVYHSHYIGSNRAFEEAVPRPALEQKVRDYLKKSVALDLYWQTRLTPAMLESETERMLKQSRMPLRLRELFSALDNDAFLIQECLARPILVDRLARSFFTADRRTSVGGRAQAGPSGEARDWDSWWATVRDDLDETRAGTVALEQASLPSSPAVRAPVPAGAEGGSAPPGNGTIHGSQALLDDTWFLGGLGADDSPRQRHDPAAIWTGSEMIVWGGFAGTSLADLGSGDHYDPATDTWSHLSTVNAPSARVNHTAVWTGREMIIWGGGADGSHVLDTGGRYDPQTDTWTATSIVAAPAARLGHSAVWTGTEMIVWGGQALATGGRYNPQTDTWSPTSALGTPEARGRHTAVWTGSEMIVWGGFGSHGEFGTGGRYDPVADAWSPVATNSAPSPRREHTAIWTGSEMIVWGGYNPEPGDPGYQKTGGRYDPLSDRWRPTSMDGAPRARIDHTAVWTGSEMIVWGGSDGRDRVGSGGRYDPARDRWRPMTTLNAPSARSTHAAVWCDGLMVVCGGREDATGGRYDPLADGWTPTSLGSAPQQRSQHTAVWTGSQMIVWGGYSGESPLATGCRYDPATSTWTPTSMRKAPSPRTDHSAVWTGDEMIVWGGNTEDLYYYPKYTSSGRAYEPLTDTWRRMPSDGSPRYRGAHSAVWTGKEMIVWGGFTIYVDAEGEPRQRLLNTGGRYDPVRSRWKKLSTVGAPEGRAGHTATFTRSEMIVWGGRGRNGQVLDTGGRYNPLARTWTPTSTAGAPTARYWHTAVWTGGRVLVWGGRDDAAPVGGGGLYDPVQDIWTPISTQGEPSPRTGHVGVWADGLLIIWGGHDGSAIVDSGGRYDPSSDQWSSMSTVNAPEARTRHAGVWTGGHLVVWGGISQTGRQATGGLYESMP